MIWRFHFFGAIFRITFVLSLNVFVETKSTHSETEEREKGTWKTESEVEKHENVNKIAIKGVNKRTFAHYNHI